MELGISFDSLWSNVAMEVIDSNFIPLAQRGPGELSLADSGEQTGAHAPPPSKQVMTLL